MGHQNSALPHSAQRNVWLSSGATLIGLALVIIFAPQQGGVASALNTLGTTLLTIGIVSFASEHLLRKALTRDLIAKIDLKERLHSAGIEDVRPLGRSDFTSMFQSPDRVTVALLRPGVSLDQLWPFIEDSAERKCEISIFLPDPAHRTSEALAERLELDRDTFRASLVESVEKVKRRWQRAATIPGAIHEKATIDVYFLPTDFGHSLIATDKGFAMLLEPFDPADGNEVTLAVQFRSRDELSSRAEWLRQSERDLLRRNDPPEWSGDRASSGGTP